MSAAAIGDVVEGERDELGDERRIDVETRLVGRDRLELAELVVTGAQVQARNVRDLKARRGC